MGQMGQTIHRKGTRYRLWSTVLDKYVTGTMTRGEMTRYIVAQARREFESSIVRDTEERMARAARNGTSSRVEPVRDATKWDTEVCHCSRFHHKFELRTSDRNCCSCGEPEEDLTHKPPCKKKR